MTRARQLVLPEPASTPTTRPAELTGMAEVERQVRVARRLYAASGPTKPWERLSPEARRPWIDRSWNAENRDLME